MRSVDTKAISYQSVTTAPVTLYQKREKIHPKHITGQFASLRKLSAYALLALYFGLPWITWNGHQAILFDLPARRFTFFSVTYWPQDFVYLALLLVVAAFALFFFTALAGRLWCGYSCPQTVWTDIFIRLEYWIEGDRRQRIKLDKTPLTAKKIRLRLIKHALWLIVSFFTGYTFVGYFTPITLLTYETLHLALGPWEFFWISFFTLATYANAGWMREQVCFYMCPYARFQSVLFDANTLIISYDTKRGEPRGKTSTQGDCIDCKQCVLVCPTGIDIRDGLQYQCIGCAACVDACDNIMDKLQRPKGLVRYTTENALEQQRTHILRPRVFLYGGLLALSTLALVTLLVMRAPVALDVIRDRNALYREIPGGWIENVYNFKLMNKMQQDQRYSLSVEGLDGIQFKEPMVDIHVPAGALRSIPAQIRAKSAGSARGSYQINIMVTDSKGYTISEKAKFFAPGNQP